MTSLGSSTKPPLLRVSSTGIPTFDIQSVLSTFPAALVKSHHSCFSWGSLQLAAKEVAKLAQPQASLHLASTHLFKRSFSSALFGFTLVTRLKRTSRLSMPMPPVCACVDNRTYIKHVCGIQRGREREREGDAHSRWPCHGQSERSKCFR